MPEQYGVITSLLRVIGLSDDWQVLEPVPGDLLGLVVIENKLGQGVVVPISTKDVDYLPDEIMIVRIRSAIADAAGRQ